MSIPSDITDDTLASSLVPVQCASLAQTHNRWSPAIFFKGEKKEKGRRKSFTSILDVTHTDINTHIHTYMHTQHTDTHRHTDIQTYRQTEELLILMTLGDFSGVVCQSLRRPKRWPCWWLGRGNLQASNLEKGATGREGTLLRIWVRSPKSCRRNLKSTRGPIPLSNEVGIYYPATREYPVSKI